MKILNRLLAGFSCNFDRVHELCASRADADNDRAVRRGGDTEGPHACEGNVLAARAADKAAGIRGKASRTRRRASRR